MSIRISILTTQQRSRVLLSALAAAIAFFGAGMFTDQALAAAPVGVAASSEIEIPNPIPVPLEGAQDGMIVSKNVMLPMRDGVRLSMDIYRPGGAGKYPVVLMRTPYGSEMPDHGVQAKFYVKHGYAFVVQDTRGKFGSDGDWFGKRDEAHDGSDTITWLGTRPWSTGKVGMTGRSYLGMVQYLVADQQNPYLKALVPMVAPTTLGRDTADYDHLAIYGARNSFSNLNWMIRTDGRDNTMDENFSSTFEAAWGHLPRKDYPRVFGRKMEWWNGFMLHQNEGFWEEYFLRAAAGNWSKPMDNTAWWASYKDRYRKINVPMLHISGWYDCCGEQPIKVYQLTRELASDPVVRENQHLILGPWVHSVGERKGGEVDFGETAAMDRDEISLWWFDRWLKGENNGVEKSARVRAFVMGENRWREADDWPIPGTKFTRFYFHSKGSAQLSGGGGALSTAAPGKEPVDRYTYDPADARPIPVQTLTGPVDMAASQMRDDVLVYTSEPLKTPVEVTGSLAATIYISTTAPSTDLMVRLFDVYPNGVVYPLFYTYPDPYRTHWAKEVKDGPNNTKIIKAEIALPPTSNYFKEGHRIRVEIASSSSMDATALGLAGRIAAAHGANNDPAHDTDVTEWTVAKQTIYHDAARPSHIVLPIIPR